MIVLNQSVCGSARNSIGQWTMQTEDQEDRNLSFINIEDSVNNYLQPSTTRINQKKNQHKIEFKGTSRSPYIMSKVSNFYPKIQSPQKSQQKTRDQQRSENTSNQPSQSISHQQLTQIHNFTRSSFNKDIKSSITDFEQHFKVVRPRIRMKNFEDSTSRDLQSSTKMKIFNRKPLRITQSLKFQLTTNDIRKPSYLQKQIDDISTQDLTNTHNHSILKQVKVKHQIFGEDQTQKQCLHDRIKFSKSTDIPNDLPSGTFKQNNQIERSATRQQTLSQGRSISPLNFGCLQGKYIVQQLREEKDMHDTLQRNLTRMLVDLHQNTDRFKSKQNQSEIRVNQMSKLKLFNPKEVSCCVEGKSKLIQGIKRFNQ